MPKTRYMVVERFRSEKVKELYARLDEQGRLLPGGVEYIDSWIDEKVEVCYQLMESESLECIHQWIERWQDLADFEVVPIITSDEARRKVLSSLD